MCALETGFEISARDLGTSLNLHAKQIKKVLVLLRLFCEVVGIYKILGSLQSDLTDSKHCLH